MGAHTGNRSILTILQKKGTCEQSTAYVTLGGVSWGDAVTYYFFGVLCKTFFIFLFSLLDKKKKDKENSLWNYIEEETYAACHTRIRLHFKHHVNLMLVTELQHCQNNSIAKQVFFCISKVHL